VSVGGRGGASESVTIGQQAVLKSVGQWTHASMRIHTRAHTHTLSHTHIHTYTQTSTQTHTHNEEAHAHTHTKDAHTHTQRTHLWCCRSSIAVGHTALSSWMQNNGLEGWIRQYIITMLIGFLKTYRVGHNPIYTVYIQQFWQGNH